MVCALSSCGLQAQLPYGTWDLPGPGIKPVSPALAGGLLPLSHQGNPAISSFILKNVLVSNISTRKFAMLILLSIQVSCIKYILCVGQG